MYGFTLKKEGKGVLAFRFDDPDRAIGALQKKGINLGSVDLFKRLEVDGHRKRQTLPEKRPVREVVDELLSVCSPALRGRRCNCMRTISTA